MSGPREVMIDAQKARDFVRIVESLAQDNAYHSEEYQRGAEETCRMFATYLDALLSDPATDRAVAA